MRRRLAMALLVLGIAGTLSEPPARAQKSAAELAVEAAEKWLALVDKGEYDKSWEAAASLFRNAVTKQQWEQTLSASRPMFGDVVSRRVQSKKYATSLPGAPDGEYVVIQFATSFRQKSAAVETVTPMKDSDGVWRVSGYFIK